MGKLKIKQKKKAFIPYTNQQANMFCTVYSELPERVKRDGVESL